MTMPSGGGALQASSVSAAALQRRSALIRPSRRCLRASGSCAPSAPRAVAYSSLAPRAASALPEDAQRSASCRKRARSLSLRRTPSSSAAHLCKRSAMLALSAAPLLAGAALRSPAARAAGTASRGSLLPCAFSRRRRTSGSLAQAGCAVPSSLRSLRRRSPAPTSNSFCIRRRADSRYAARYSCMDSSSPSSRAASRRPRSDTPAEQPSGSNAGDVAPPRSLMVVTGSKTFPGPPAAGPWVAMTATRRAVQTCMATSSAVWSFPHSL